MSITSIPGLAPVPDRPAAPAPRADVPPQQIQRGTPAYRQVSIALFLAGFSSFSLLYCVQPLLPAFAQSFGISPASASLALSLTTGALAFAILAAGAFSQALGRRGLMFASMALAAVLNMAVALSPSWNMLLVTRLAEGLVLGGVPAVAMAYLAEEIDPRHLGKAMGLYVAGTAFGAMVGRVGMGVLTELTSWRGAMGILGIVGLAAALGFVALLPPSRNFVVQRGFRPRYHLATWGGHLRNTRLARLFAVGFALTSVFVTMFNYTGFRLTDAPYGLSQTAIAMVFLAFAFGIVSSSMAGGLADRFGRRLPLAAGVLIMVAGVLVTLAQPLPLIILGIVMVTVGFFIAHSVVSGWIGRLAGAAKGHASSLYLLFYYLGSSVTGSVGGWFWSHGGWPAVVMLTGALGVLGLVLALTVREE
ncbi:MFS transporter [Agaricicola taiwanensis]|uniref:MFS transporter n=1 Tax=Agaricicola taiwanensis TaxID=591372 RepID=A0A8J2YLB3_9RHOB|nr:MFS transporter [Agaricicola taiwanensis]GGE51483.1 MFS transporter [Agaricicola taiwanensis]